MDVFYSHEAPSVQEYLALKVSVGWGKTPPDLAKIALGNSLCHVSARAEGRLLASACVSLFNKLPHQIDEIGVLGQGIATIA